MQNNAKIVLITDDVAAGAIHTSIKNRCVITEVIRAKEMAVLLALDFKKCSYVVIFDSEMELNLRDHLFKLKARYSQKLVLVQMTISTNAAVAREIDFNINKLNIEAELAPIYNRLFGE